MALNTPTPPKKTPLWQILALALVLLLAVFLHFFRLEQEGFGNLYYAAAVKSMLTSWHNFFFVSFDPGGFVTVDKPPLGLWVQAISALIFGFNGFSLLLPQALAGVLSVALLYHLVQRVFSPTAGLLAALVLALTPISVAANRNNTMDSLLVLTCLLAAWAISLAAERGRLGWLVVSFFLIGVGFNIKMLQATMVLPAFGLLYLAAAPLKWWKRLTHLVLASMVLIVVSLSWAVIVDLTPPDQRPFIGSSQDNTVMELIIGHNGVQRLGMLADVLGLRSKPPAVDKVKPPNNPIPIQPANPNSSLPPAPLYANPQGAPGVSGGNPSIPSPQNALPPYNAPPPNVVIPAPNPPYAPAGSAGAAGQQGGGVRDETGAPGILRLFNRSLAGQISWFLPLSGLCLLAAAWQVKLRRPLDRRHQALLLWAAWLLPQAVFFSFAGLFHRYYLEMMAPAIASLVGAGLAAMWSDTRKCLVGSASSSNGKLGLTELLKGWLLPLALLATTGVELFILNPFPDWSRWLAPLVIGCTLIAVVILVIVLLSSQANPSPKLTSWAAFATTIGLVGILIAPAVWAAIPVWYGGDAGLPFAGPDVLHPRDKGAPDVSLLSDFLLSNRHGEAFLLATINAREAAPFILATGEAVMAMGGFTGSDQIISVEDLAAMVKNGIVRFFLLPRTTIGPIQTPKGQLPYPGQPAAHPKYPPAKSSPKVPQTYAIAKTGPVVRMPEILHWVQLNCQPVAPRNWAGQNIPPNVQAPNTLGMVLWDCGK